MPTALIADDEPHLAAHLQRLLATLWPALEVVHVAAHGLEAAERLEALRPDVAFLDIRMPGLTGLEVAQGLQAPTRIVFVTAYDEFAVQAFEQEAIDYVLKPVKAERLALTIERLQRATMPADERLADALRRLLPSAPPAPRLRYVRASQGDVVHQVPVESVLYFRADDKYTVVRTAQAEHLIRTPIAELAAQLDPEQFWQVHRSTIIHLRHMAGTRRDALSRLFVRLRGCPEELPVSRAYVHRFKAM